MANIIKGGIPVQNYVTTAQISQNRRVIEMHSDILMYDTEAAPLSLLAASVNKQAVNNPKFELQTDDLIPHLDRVSGAFTAGATTLSFDNIAYFPVNSLIKVQRTGEVILRQADASTNTVDCLRGYGGTAAAALLDDDQVVALGGAAAEGATAEVAIATQAGTDYNLTQIFRWPVDVVGTLMASELYGPAELPWQHKKAGIEMAKRLDLSGFFGERSSDPVVAGGTTNARRTSGGLLEFISTNSEDMGGSFSLQTFMTLANTFFRHGRKSKIMFASRGLVSNIALEAIQFIETTRSDDTLGLKISTLETPHGTLKIIAHDLLEGDYYGGYGFIVDLDNFGMRFLKGRDVKLYTKIKSMSNDGYDGQKDEYLGELGWWRAKEKTHGLLSNAA